MLTTISSNPLDRALVQSVVIEANLQRLAVTLACVDHELCDEVRCCVEDFERCVQHLHEASATPRPGGSSDR